MQFRVGVVNLSVGFLIRMPPLVFFETKTRGGILINTIEIPIFFRLRRAFGTSKTPFLDVSARGAIQIFGYERTLITPTLSGAF